MTRRTTVVLAVALVASTVIATAAWARSDRFGSKFDVEVAEDPTRFVFDGDHVIEDGELAGFPAYGDGFITQGWIYPAGTLENSVDGDGIVCETDTDGVPTSCEPEFPDLVIGEWTCYGTHVGEGAATTEGSWVVTTQIYDFGSDYHGDRMVVTEGFESPEMDEVSRAITGGTGRWARARGEQTQTFLGFGPHFNALIESTFRIHR